jgi:N-acetylneuraminate synthase
VISSYGNELALLHCVLEYPTPKEHANLKRITALAQRYPGCIIGYSDHTKPTENEEVITTAYVLGAKIIEKHFTLDKTIPGNDHYHAMDETDLAKIKNALENEKLILGKGGLSYLESEKTARANARRSIVTTKYLKAGSVLGDQDITFKRPGLGITPDDYKKVLGRELIHDVQEDYILQWGDLK